LSNRTAEGLILNLHLVFLLKSQRNQVDDLSEFGFGNEDDEFYVFNPAAPQRRYKFN
jgi:hypothetical protein